MQELNFGEIEQVGGGRINVRMIEQGGFSCLLADLPWQQADLP